MLKGRPDFNREIKEFQLLFLFSFVRGSVLHKIKVSSLNKFEGVSAQRHSFLKATYRRYAYIFETENYVSYGHPGSFNPAVITNKEAHMVYGDMKNDAGSSQAAGFHKKTSRKFLPHQPLVLVKCKGQPETLTAYFNRKENIF